MINDEKLEQLYEEIIERNELTTKKLNEYGFNANNITELIDKGILKRIKRGYYDFSSVEGLFLYGKKLIIKREYNKSYKCFKKCYELNPYHIGTHYQMVISNLQSRKYDESFEYFKIIYEEKIKNFIKIEWIVKKIN